MRKFLTILAAWRLHRDMEMRAWRAALFTDRRGVTALEYGLIAALVAVAIIVPVLSLGKNLSTVFDIIVKAV